MQVSQRDEITAMLTMAREAIASTEALGEPVEDWQIKNVARLESELAALGGSVGVITNIAESVGTPRALTSRPVAGAPASNQYGTFTVAYASELQTRFIKGLLEQKDLTKIRSEIGLDIAKLREQVANLQVNKRAASAIIDRLLALPDLPVRPVGEKATDKQLALIRRLATEKELSADDRSKVLAAVDTLSKKGASATLDKLFALPVAAPAQIEAGVYTDETQTIRVYLGQQSGKMLCAKVIEHLDGTAEFDYLGQADRFITSAFRRLTIEEAAKFGQTTGTCIVCARRLDVPESVERGIGPVCFAKMS